MKTNQTGYQKPLLTQILSLAVSFSLIACNIRGGVTGVIKEQTAEPSRGARVEIYDDRKKRNVYEIETGADGRFEYYEENFVVFNGYCGPSLKVRIAKAGFKTQEQEFSYLCQLKRYDPVLQPE